MLKTIDSMLWATATIFLLYSGIYYTYKLKFVQFRFQAMFQNLFSKKKEKDSISSFQSLMLVLGGRIGVGSIAGIALAIYLGGIGSIFWVWVAGFLSAPNTFAETILGSRYQEKDEKNIYKGGPSYYLNKGLHRPGLGKIYAIIMVISQIGGCLSIQSNTIVRSLKSYISVPAFIIGLLVALLCFIIIMGGVQKISNVSSKLVPFMTGLYVLIAGVVVFRNLEIIPTLFSTIIRSAFNIKAFEFGVLGSMIVGMQRGIFSNEAGLGTGAIAASTVDTDFPARQGFVQMIGIYITTFLICTATAIIILTSNANLNLQNVNGIEIAQEAFIYHLGNIGNFILLFCIILFCFSSVLACYYDGESNYKYLFPQQNKIIILKISSAIILIIGAVASSEVLWQIVNIFTALLAIINIYALIKLRKEVLFEWKRYDKCVTMK